MKVTKVTYINNVTPASNVQDVRDVNVSLPDITQNGSKESKNNFADKNNVDSSLYKKEMNGIEKGESESEEIGSNSAEQELSEEEKEKVDELKKIDAEVRAHEQAHVSAGGSLVKGGIKFSYQVGPDNRKYAVGGKVNIDIAPVKGDPEATIRKMQQVKRSALAPADPSPQDRQIATTAAQVESKARSQLRQEKSIENDTQYKYISKASKNRAMEEYQKQQNGEDYNMGVNSGAVLNQTA